MLSQLNLRSYQPAKKNRTHVQVFCSSVSKVTAFEQWFQQKAGHVQNYKLRVMETDDSGYGIKTTEAIDASDKKPVLVVPKQLIISRETVINMEQYGSILSQVGLSNWQCLSIFLIMERGKGQSSEWWPYLNSLPNMEDSPLLWGRSTVDLLQGSFMSVTLAIRHALIEQDYHLFLSLGLNDLPLAQQYKQQHNAALITLRSLTWANAILHTRAFSLTLNTQSSCYCPVDRDPDDVAVMEGDDVDDGAEDVLVPWADLVNHDSALSSKLKSCLSYDAKIGGAVLYPESSYKAGSEILGTYGMNLTPSELLINYGFVDVNKCTDFQSYGYNVPADAIVEPQSPANSSLLHCTGMGNLDFVLRPQGLDVASLTWVKACIADEDVLRQCGWTPPYPNYPQPYENPPGGVQDAVPQPPPNPAQNNNKGAGLDLPRVRIAHVAGEQGDVDDASVFMVRREDRDRALRVLSKLAQYEDDMLTLTSLQLFANFGHSQLNKQPSIPDDFYSVDEDHVQKQLAEQYAGPCCSIYRALASESIALEAFTDEVTDTIQEFVKVMEQAKDTKSKKQKNKGKQKRKAVKRGKTGQ